VGDVPFQVWSFLAPAFAGAALAVVALFANRRIGLNPAKDSLIVALQGRITVLESENRDLKTRVGHLEQVILDERELSTSRRRAAADV
jgi:hypothetical protein